MLILLSWSLKLGPLSLIYLPPLRCWPLVSHEPIWLKVDDVPHGFSYFFKFASILTPRFSAMSRALKIFSHSALNRFPPVTSFDPLSNGAERRGLSFCFGGIFHLSFQARGPNAVFHSAAMPVPIQHHPLGHDGEFYLNNKLKEVIHGQLITCSFSFAGKTREQIGN